MRRTVIVIAFVGLASGASAKPTLPDCSQKFLATWLWNRQAAMAALPAKPCLTYGETQQYVCDRKGCIAR